MIDKIRPALLVALLLVGQTSAFAEAKPLEMKWNELAPMIGTHRVGLILTDGLIVKGEVVAVREDSILLDVSSPVKGYTKGNGSVPRASLAMIDLERRRGAWGRTMGTVLGALGGMGLGGYVAAKKADGVGTGIGVFVGIAAGASVAGYYIGRNLDKRVTHIKVVP
jgi:hypothetical protein